MKLNVHKFILLKLMLILLAQQNTKEEHKNNKGCVTLWRLPFTLKSILKAKEG
jgi:hypothetical protein